MTRLEVLHAIRQWEYEVQRADQLGVHPTIVGSHQMQLNYYRDLLEQLQLCGADTTEEIK